MQTQCKHNTMVENTEPGFAWKCADCGYVYGKEEQYNAALDAWIDALPNDVYGLFPCGCGKKLKFVIPEVEKHEKAFIEKRMNNT